MKSRLPLLMPLIVGGMLAGLLLLVLPRDWSKRWDWGFPTSVTPPSREAGAHFQRPDRPKAASAAPAEEDLDAALLYSETAARILALLQRRLEVEGAREKEALLTFRSEEAYREFLARANASGLRVMDQLDGFRTVRVGYDDLTALQSDLMGHAGDYGNIGANYFAYLPETPAKEERAAQNEVPFGDRMLPFLGVTGDHSMWGQGVTIAILDSGVAADVTFGTGRIRYLDIGLGLQGAGEGDGHGTAVAALALGEAGDAMGVAPSAQGLSIRVTGEDGVSDLFTLAKGITTAVDSGAQIINISLGAYQNSNLLTQAIDYAISKGSVVVAPSGNDQAAQMTWPAADPRVISVGAVDALEQQATFSNSGENLQITAPGYGINTAWLNGERVVFDGTSGSAPIVAGAVAAMMSQNAGMSAPQAWEVLRQYSSDGGAPGADPAYGNGILNLGWAINRNDPARVDTAVSSHYYNNQTGQMEIVVQNRSGQGMGGLNLYLSDSLNQTSWTVPYLEAGARTTFSVPVNQEELARSPDGIPYRSQLINPNGAVDVQLSNNSKASTISKR